MTALQITGLPENVPVTIEKEQRGEAEMYSVTIGHADGEAIALSEVRVTVTADASGAVGAGGFRRRTNTVEASDRPGTARPSANTCLTRRYIPITAPTTRIF